MLLQTDNLDIGYGRFTIQKKLNLHARAGELICLIGTNGCGKSTLLKTLCGILKPLQGKIYINRQNLARLNCLQRSEILSVVLTDGIDVENMTVYDLVALGRFPYTDWTGRLSSYDSKMISHAIEQVNLTLKCDANLHEISDGEKQRAVIAKALAQDTPLILLDEPTVHLDLPNRVEIMMLLRRLSVNTSKTFILSTHELDLAMQVADSIWIMSGKGVETGIAEDLMLEGKIQTLFGNESLVFDHQTGNFVVKQLTGNLQACIKGEGISALWLRRALNRYGVKVVHQADICIEIQNSHFIIHHPSKPSLTTHTIADVLKNL